MMYQQFDGTHRLLIEVRDGNHLVADLEATVADDPDILRGMAAEFERRAAGLARLAIQAGAVARLEPTPQDDARAADNLDDPALQALVTAVTATVLPCAECGLPHSGVSG